MKRIVRGIVVAALLLAFPAGAAFAVEHESEISPGEAITVVSFGDLDRDEPHRITARFAWRKVDGAALYAGYQFNDRTCRLPRIWVEGGYSVEREKGLGTLEISQPIDRAGRWLIGGGTWSATRNFEFDDEIVGSTENTLAAFWATEDRRDWYDGRGARLFAHFDPASAWRIEGAFAVEDQRPLSNATDFGVFGPDEFRANPAATRGSLHAASFRLTHDSRPDSGAGIPLFGDVPVLNGDWIRLTWDGAGNPLGGDFDYGLLRIDGRFWCSPGARHHLGARLMGARSTGGELPPQAELYAGGPSTLRAHLYKAERGDRLALVNAEYAFDVWAVFQAMAFLDFGSAWRDEEKPDGPKMGLDAGFGVQTLDQHFRVLLARDLRRDDGGLLLTVRTTATF